MSSELSLNSPNYQYISILKEPFLTHPKFNCTWKNNVVVPNLSKLVEVLINAEPANGNS